MNKKLKCFVASAFGRKDVDMIFNKAIIPVLKELNIRPLRVDKINHNRNIDQKIISLIDECDFCIADLSYARPSGLALRPADGRWENDNEGNFKIHFDLITKNIIGWPAPSISFKRMLKSRVRLITSPLVVKTNEDIQQIREVEAFKRKAYSERLLIISNLSKKVIEDLKYKVTINNPLYKAGVKPKGKLKRIIASLSYDSITTKRLQSFHFYTTFFTDIGGVNVSEQSDIILIINSLHPIRTIRIQKNLSDLKKTLNEKVFTSKDPLFNNRNIKYVFIDNIQSESDYLNRIAKIDLS